MQYERIRDFLVLHYTANRRVGEPLWDYVRSMPLPDSLVHKLALFRARAALPNYQYGLFARDSWLSVLVGQGINPRGYDRLADAFTLDALEERLAELREPHSDQCRRHGVAWRVHRQLLRNPAGDARRGSGGMSTNATVVARGGGGAGCRPVAQCQRLERRTWPGGACKWSPSSCRLA